MQSWVGGCKIGRSLQGVVAEVLVGRAVKCEARVTKMPFFTAIPFPLNGFCECEYFC
jgi:hypothetical protein